MPNRKEPLPKVFQTDVLVIGSGLAGLLATLKLIEAGVSVVLASKGALSDSNSSMAQGGLAASLPANHFDSAQLHLEDTIKAGCGLVEPLAAEVIISDANELISYLMELGVVFDQDNHGTIMLAREGGHCRSRILHTKDETGKSITAVLIEKLKQRERHQKGYRNYPRLALLENAFALGLLTNENQCIGARFNVHNRIVSVLASHTILATGGLGQVYSRTTNPLVATGDGIALAYRSGATLVDMEFVQFHPTALAIEGAPAFLISEAVRGAGAVLLDRKGDRFMKRFHSDAELATRDIVARAIHAVMQAQDRSQVHLDLRPIGLTALSSHFPNILAVCRRFGIDPMIQPIPVSPAAHYFMGGIMTDINGNTSIGGLSAVGECASVGLHGANRLASNSLLEAGVMAMRTAAFLMEKSSIDQSVSAPEHLGYLSIAPYTVSGDLAMLRESMFKNVGLIREEHSLQQTLDFISKSTRLTNLDTPSIVQASNMQLLAKLIIQSALYRRESRGTHFRNDFEKTNDLVFKKRLTVNFSDYAWIRIADTLPTNIKHLSQKPVAIAAN